MRGAAAARSILARAHLERLETVAGDRREWAEQEQVARPERAEQRPRALADPAAAQPVREQAAQTDPATAQRARVASPARAVQVEAQPEPAAPGPAELVQAQPVEPAAPAAFLSIAPGLSPARAPFTAFRIPYQASRAWIRTKC